MQKALKDPSSAVRTAASRALCRMEMPEDALPVLIHELTKGTQWERLHAAIVLDEIDEQARPVIELGSALRLESEPGVARPCRNIPFLSPRGGICQEQ